MVTAGDTGYYLRVMASYTDGHGSGKEEMAMTANAVGAEPMTLMGRYDNNPMDGKIDRGEVGTAVRHYFSLQISEVEVAQVIAQYFADRRAEN
jgi:hypothetical protein